MGSRLDDSSQHVSRVSQPLGQPDRRPTFPDRLETEPGIPCIDPGGGGWFGRLAEQSPLTEADGRRRRRSFLELWPSTAPKKCHGSRASACNRLG